MRALWRWMRRILCEPLKWMYPPGKVRPFWQPFQHIIQLFSQTAFASIWNYVPSIVLVPSRQMRIMGKGKRFFWLASSCTFDLCTDLHCNNCPTFYYLPFFVKMLPHFELKMSNYRSFLIEGFKLQVGSS